MPNVIRTTEFPEGLPRPSTENGRLLLQVIFTSFKKEGRWPSPKKTHRILLRSGTSLPDALHDLPEGLIHGADEKTNLRDTLGEIQLTLAGAANCSGSDRILELFFEIIKAAADKEREETRWTSQRVRIQPSEVEEVKSKLTGCRFRNPVDFVVSIAKYEPWCIGAARSGGWEVIHPASLTVDSRIRFFARSRTLSEYWNKREDFAQQSRILRKSRTLDDMHPDIIRVAGHLWEDAHFTQAILSVFRHIEYRVQHLYGDHSESGQALMGKAFSDANQGLNVRRSQDMSGQSEQAGFKFLFMGAMAGLRNPRAHGHPPDDDEAEAYEAIAFGSLLLRRLDLAAGRASDGDQ
ncbi:TIGR02391 family protein [Streptomyces sp. NRRL S-1448]|uniref:TIGR02391 family protein n=1 Tax=Streptomyces sp. NRRL S-1448 TaxID=1463883 RepID=UPI001F4277AA|nr:TIGR02391 family protein [Streptomyces sp. NRRL S-1448]